MKAEIWASFPIYQTILMECGSTLARTNLEGRIVPCLRIVKAIVIK